MIKKRIQMRLETLLLIEDDNEFKLHTGVKKKVFFKMLSILDEEYKTLHVHGSNKGIGPACKLVIALCYWREYRAMRQMAKDFDLALSTVCNSISWVENTLKKDKEFQFQDIKIEIEKYENKNGNIEFVIGDVTEQQIEIPSINQEEYYSGKKKKILKRIK